MSSLNKVLLIGRLGKDPEIQHFESGAMKANFSVATSEKYSNRDGAPVESTEWHNIVIWGKLAGIAEKYLRRGKQVYIEGKLKTRSWEDRDGNKRYITEIVAYNFLMLGSKGNERADGHQNQSSGNSNSKVQTRPATPPPTVEKPTVVDASDDELDDLPF